MNLTDYPVDYIDVRKLVSENFSLTLKDTEFEQVNTGQMLGIGVRALHNGFWGFAATNLDDPKQVIEKAIGIAKLASKKAKSPSNLKEIQPANDKVQTDFKKDPRNIDPSEKQKLLLDYNSIMQEHSDKIKTTQIRYAENFTTEYFYNSDGADIESKSLLTYLNCSATAKEGNNIQLGRKAVGKFKGFELIENQESMPQEAAETAVRLLAAKKPPSGESVLVMDPELVGTFIHEAVGHACEADHIIKGNSILKDKLNEQIGSSILSVFDDATVSNAFGTFSYDDEGTPGQKSQLIKDGILQGYLHSRESAEKLDMDPTGNCRAQSYDTQPIIRMSNTFVGNGDSKFEELIEDIPTGVYLKGSRGGQVDTTRGVFQFNSEQGYLIKNGELTQPIRDASLSGEILKILNNIDRIGNDISISSPGFCGKNGQWVPTDVGGPHVRTKAIVGGV